MEAKQPTDDFLYPKEITSTLLKPLVTTEQYGFIDTISVSFVVESDSEVSISSTSYIAAGFVSNQSPSYSASSIYAQFAYDG